PCTPPTGRKPNKARSRTCPAVWLMPVAYWVRVAMPSKEEEIYQQRLNKLERLRARGIDPYPPRFPRTHAAADAIAAFEAWEAAPEGDAPSATLAGRVTALRRMGKAAFLDLRDGSGRIQVSVRIDRVGESAYETLRDTDLGDILGVSGPL